MSSFRIAFFGPPGSGKGTQGAFFAHEFHILLLTTGTIFRKNISEHTQLGKQVESVLKQGGLVSDSLTNEVIQGRLQEEDCVSGFILDGYPRNMIQANFLNTLTALTHALFLHLPDEIVYERISKRWMCHCGASYHLISKPPKKPGVCDACGQALFQRNDDTPEVLKVRLESYHKNIEPVLSYYRAKDILHEIDGTKDIEEVRETIRKILV